MLMTSPGQRQLVSHALAEVVAGREWTATVADGSLGVGRFAIRCEPLAGLDGGALVIVQHVSPQPVPSWLSEASARIGSTLDLTQTASEVVDAAVPWFAGAAVIYAAEHLLAADELSSPRAGHGPVARRPAGYSGSDAPILAVIDGRSARCRTDGMLASAIAVGIARRDRAAPVPRRVAAVPSRRPGGVPRPVPARARGGQDS